MKKSKKKKEKIKFTRPGSVIQQDLQPDNEKENSFDFGGLPLRDIKKNLGCG